MIAALGAYFSAIGRTVVSFGDGLAVTGSYFLRKPVTIQYPDRTAKPVVVMLPKRSRGLLEIDLDICTGCVACERVCPLSCIHIDVTKGKERFITKFEIELDKCMSCGLCEEACPSAGIHHTREFEGGTSRVSNLVIDFVEQPKPVAKAMRKGEPEPVRKPVGSILLHFLPTAFASPMPRAPKIMPVVVAPAAAAPAATATATAATTTTATTTATKPTDAPASPSAGPAASGASVKDGA